MPPERHASQHAGPALPTTSQTNEATGSLYRVNWPPSRPLSSTHAATKAVMRLRQARRGGCDALSVCGVRLVQQLHELVRLTVLDVNIVERAAC